MHDYEIVKFNNGEFELDVNVSPEEDTVWLSLMDLCHLFNRDKSVISRHIKNIFNDNELIQEQVVAKNATTGPDGKTYNVSYYNLDVIISVGYRVHSKNGVVFRKWANRVLKDYLIKGYAVNPKKIEITIDDWNAFDTRVSYMENKLRRIEDNLFKEPIKDQIFIEGQYYDAYKYVTKILKSAKSSVVVVDPYFDLGALKYLNILKTDIHIEVYTSLRRMTDELEVITFKKQHPHFFIFITSSFHDRFLIIDEKRCFQIGASLNSIGNRTFSAFEIHDQEQISFILRKAKSNKKVSVKPT